MKKILVFIFICLTVSMSLWGFYRFGTNKGFMEYVLQADYRRQHPELLPSPILIRALDMGHTTSYASFMWLQFIQYIADNLSEDRYLSFSHTVLNQITTLHPYFIRPYEIDLLLTPFSRSANIDSERRKKSEEYAVGVIELGKKGIMQLCDMDKIDKIMKKGIIEAQYDSTLRNPCPSSTLPYYLGFTISQIGKRKTEGSDYYNIASMHDDAPQASRLLGLLALSAEGDHRSSALNFLLLGSNGYDIEPYSCQNLAKTLFPIIQSNIQWTPEGIEKLSRDEEKLQNTKDPKNPLSLSGDNCYDMTTRGIRAIYLSYITESASGTTFTTGEELIKNKIIPEIPSLSSQKNYQLIKRNNIWTYESR